MKVYFFYHALQEGEKIRCGFHGGLVFALMRFFETLGENQSEKCFGKIWRDQNTAVVYFEIFT